MNLFQQFFRGLSWAGISGLIRNAYRNKMGNRSGHYKQRHAEYERLNTAFTAKVKELNYYDEVKHFQWYHTIDLGNGMITPGALDYREVLPTFGFPASMKGMNVLDVGSGSGFFAFEFEKRGASVTSVDIPSLEEMDLLPGETLQQKLEAFRRQSAQLEGCSFAELYHRLTDGPFKFAHKILKSTVERRYCNIYDLSEEKLGRSNFDFVFLGDILLHLFLPQKALMSVAPLCRGTLVIAQQLPKANFAPGMLYRGGDKPDGGLEWWSPNRLCLEQLLKKMGFKSVVKVGQLGHARHIGQTILHASR